MDLMESTQLSTGTRNQRLSANACSTFVAMRCKVVKAALCFWWDAAACDRTQALCSMSQTISVLSISSRRTHSAAVGRLTR